MPRSRTVVVCVAARLCACGLGIPPGQHLHPTLTGEEADLYLLAHAESMKKIEQSTGLHFLTDVPTAERTAVEQNASTALWPIN